MEHSQPGHTYDLIINGHKFTTTKQFITGKEILELAKLSPDDGFEILMKIKDKEFEPVELDETKDLGQEVERFEVNSIKKLTISLDDEDAPVPNCFMTPVQILDLKGYKPEGYYLKQILGHKEINYKEDENHVIAIVCGMKFSTCKKGPTGVS